MKIIVFSKFDYHFTTGLYLIKTLEIIMNGPRWNNEYVCGKTVDSLDDLISFEYLTTTDVIRQKSNLGNPDNWYRISNTKFNPSGI
jgi:hypothetical protein